MVDLFYCYQYICLIKDEITNCFVVYLSSFQFLDAKKYPTSFLSIKTNASLSNEFSDYEIYQFLYVIFIIQNGSDNFQVHQWS
ncbi:unnamed protein product [Rotaria magnacalcarata]